MPHASNTSKGRRRVVVGGITRWISDTPTEKAESSRERRDRERAIYRRKLHEYSDKDLLKSVGAAANYKLTNEMRISIITGEVSDRVGLDKMRKTRVAANKRDKKKRYANRIVVPERWARFYRDTNLSPGWKVMDVKNLADKAIGNYYHPGRGYRQNKLDILLNEMFAETPDISIEEYVAKVKEYGKQVGYHTKELYALHANRLRSATRARHDNRKSMMVQLSELSKIRAGAVDYALRHGLLGKVCGRCISKGCTGGMEGTCTTSECDHWHLDDANVD